MQQDRIFVIADPAELRGSEPAAAVDVYAALGTQFFWADTVMVSPQAPAPDELEVLEGDVVE